VLDLRRSQAAGSLREFVVERGRCEGRGRGCLIERKLARRERGRECGQLSELLGDLGDAARGCGLEREPAREPFGLVAGPVEAVRCRTCMGGDGTAELMLSPRHE
jgi:hypothetical protein